MGNAIQVLKLCKVPNSKVFGDAVGCLNYMISNGKLAERNGSANWGNLFLEEINNDRHIVTNSLTAFRFISFPLWQQDHHDIVSEQLFETLPTEDRWDVWGDWYRGHLLSSGADSSFEAAVLDFPDVFWRKDPKLINKNISELLGLPLSLNEDAPL